MATANHVLLRRITLTASASSITFDNIPQTGYTDLKIVFSVRSTDDYLNVSFNGLTTNLSSRTLGANSGGAFSISASNGLVYGLSESNSWTANTFNNAEMYIPNYTSSNAKSWSVDAVTENNGTAITLTLAAGLWNSTAAITSISFNQGANNILAGSSFSLYGIANAATTPLTAPKADGGDIIKTDGTYWYHAFLSSGSFKPQLNLTADVLVVAGGGGGGNYHAGGGGAGGVLAFASQALASTTSYTCTVGAGGAGAPGPSATGASGTSGANSQFGSLTASIGGGYGASNSNTGGTGGSGGGTKGGTGGSGTSGQGYAGGGFTGGNSSGGGGGGGAGGAGQNSNDGQGKNGGVGVNTYTNWGSLSSALTTTGLGVSGYIAGGGGGGNSNGTGAAGLGQAGGGNGGHDTSPNSTAALPNTGSGGGGGGGDQSGYYGSAGGSGFIIIRYAV